MILESLSFKYIVELFNFFKVNKIDLTYTKVNFLDRTRTNSMQFYSYDTLNAYYIANYKVIDACEMGRYAYITHFRVESSLYGFEIKFEANDICLNYNLRVSYPYDKDKLNIIEAYLNKQKFLIDKNVSTYCNYSAKFKSIYLYEVYSPCFAEPSWSEGTSNIKTYRDLVKINDYKVYKN